MEDYLTLTRQVDLDQNLVDYDITRVEVITPRSNDTWFAPPEGCFVWVVEYL